METFADRLVSFYETLQLRVNVKDVVVMNPYRDKNILNLNLLFAKKYFTDNNKRIFILGINPGRFGSGVTGVSFTDPVRLENECGIRNDIKKKSELSSVFVYDFINAFGGARIFYKHFFISALCPLGFLKHGKNLNYYDDKKLQAVVEPFIIKTLQQQINLGADLRYCICLGEGKNYSYFNKLNEKYHFFEMIIPLSHPRWIMQYRRKKTDEYIKKYVSVLENLII